MGQKKSAEENGRELIAKKTFLYYFHMLISTLLFLLLYRVEIKKPQLATQLAKCQFFLAGKRMATGML